jgi:hypothetical protein
VHRKYIPICIQTRCNVTQFIYIWKLIYMFRVVPPPIIRSAYNCIYSIWYLSLRYCYLPLSWKSWNRFERAVGGVRHCSTIAADSSNGVTNTRCCRYSCMRSWWWVEVPPETCRAVPYINKLCNVASCWIYEYIGILLGAHPILHISRIRVNSQMVYYFGHIVLEILHNVLSIRNILMTLQWSHIVLRFV